jgi:glycosyltransferase involved in cell wall biosynthesis
MTHQQFPMLGLAIATTGERFECLESLIVSSQSALAKAGEVVVVVQSMTPRVEEMIRQVWRSHVQLPNLRIVADEGRGLSRSRNLAFNAARSEFIWLLDDDVEICSDAVDAIEKALVDEPGDIYCGRVQCRNSDGMFKKYSNVSRLKKIDVLRVMSIEMIISQRFISSTGVRFCERIGYGTEFPAGAETVFLLDAYDRGARIWNLKKTIVKHYCDKGNFYRKWSEKNVMLMKGVVARRMGLIYGPLLLGHWSLRGIRRGLPLRYIVPLHEGFIKGKKINASWIEQKAPARDRYRRP